MSARQISLAAFDQAVLLQDAHEFRPPNSIFVPRSLPQERHCAWCDEENGVRYIGNVTHSICPRHMASNLMEYSGKDDAETLWYAVLAFIAEAA